MTQLSIRNAVLGILLLTVAAPVVDGQPRAPLPHSLDAVIRVVVRRDVKSGCTIDVWPNNRENGAWLKPGWWVGWVLVNECDDTTTMDLTFEYVGKRDARTAGVPKEPFRFEPMYGFLKIGHAHGGFFGCDKDRAPCGIYKYTVKVGNYSLDPELEIEKY